MQDADYRRFQCALTPTVAPETVLGVRIPLLRQLARRMQAQELSAPFLEALPHQWYDENNLHALLLGQIRDYESCVVQINRFLPHVDNWATCDLLRPRCFRTHRAALLEDVRRWLDSSHAYTVRFGLEMLMVHFLQEDFQPAFLAMAAAVRSDDYYVQMMVAWYFATALTLQWSDALPYLEQRRLPDWIHGKTIQKALESRRIPPERKALLRSLRLRAHAERE